MCSRFLSVAALLIALSVELPAQLRVCADPDNLPFSNRAQQGFENRIAQTVAQAMNLKVEYQWQRMGRGFVRDVVNKHKCDIVLGIPENFPALLTTEPYYRSTYVFVTRRANRLRLTSFDDPDLRKLKVGVQIVGEDYAPPAQALGRRGLVANIVGFDITGSTASSIIEAVAKKSVDAAVVWGPFAGYFGRKYRSELSFTPTPTFDAPCLPLTFAISMGVRKNDTELRDRLNRVLAKEQPQIDRILRGYNVPLLPIRPENGRRAE